MPAFCHQVRMPTMTNRNPIPQEAHQGFSGLPVEDEGPDSKGVRHREPPWQGFGHLLLTPTPPTRNGRPQATIQSLLENACHSKATTSPYCLCMLQKPCDH